MVVAVPARDEATRIGRLVHSLGRAVEPVQARVRVVVACDSSSDDTAAAAAAAAVHSGVQLDIVEGAWGCAGAARAAAVDAALASVAGPAGSVWIANTDADCVVPPNWLTRHLRQARTSDAVAGIVTLDRRRTAPWLLVAFDAAYLVGPVAHHHVHGANLGVRGSAYLASGGWCPSIAVGEDHDLWARLNEAGARAVHDSGLVVTTSSRLRSRVEGGFATDLRRLADHRGPEALDVVGASDG